MSERGYKGKTLAILLNGQRIAAVRAKSVAHNRTPIDRSDEENTGWRYLDARVDSRSVTIGVEGVATIENYALLSNEWLGSLFSDVTVQHPDGIIEEAEDGAFLQSLTRSGEHDGHVAFEASFIFSGLVSLGTPPVPLLLTQLIPATTQEGADGFVMKLIGQGFEDGAVGLWGGSPRATTFVSSTELEMTVLEVDLEEAGTVLISVRNPDNNESNSLTFNVVAESLGQFTFHDGVYTRNSYPNAISVDGFPAIGAVSSSGDIIVAYVGGDPLEFLSATIRASFLVDDHAYPTFLIRESDNRVMAFYAGHPSDELFYALSTNPLDVSSWQTPVNVDSQVGAGNYTYSTPIQLTGEANSPIYWIFRCAVGPTLAFYYSKSEDDGTTWSSATQLIAPGPDELPAYLVAVRNGTTRIDFACQNRSHESRQASVYHFYYEGGSFYDTEGNELTLPITPESVLAPIWDGSGAEGGAKVLDIAVDEDEHPIIVYNIYGRRSYADQRYRYAKWDGQAWIDNEIVAAGGWIASDDSEQFDYNAGVSINSDDPGTVFCGIDVGGTFRIARFSTPDDGATWTGRVLTSDDEHAFRPVYARAATVEPKLGYLTGRYDDYDDYDTDIHLVESDAEGVEVPVDEDWDYVVLLATFQGVDNATSGAVRAPDLSRSRHTFNYGSGGVISTAATKYGRSSLYTGDGPAKIIDPSNDFLLGDANFTIDGWFRFPEDLTPDTNDRYIVSLWRTTSDGSWALVLRTDGYLAFRGTEDGTDGNAVDILEYDVASNLSLDTWYWIRVTREGNDFSLQLDDNIVDTDTRSFFFFHTPARLGIGSREIGNDQWSTGGRATVYVEDLRITRTARAAANAPVRGLPHFGPDFGAVPTPDTSSYRGLVLSDEPLAYYRFGEPGGGRLKDEARTPTSLGAVTGSVTYGVTGAITGDSDTAISRAGDGSNYITLPVVLAFQTGGGVAIEFWAEWTSGVLIRDATTAGGTFPINASGGNLTARLGGTDINTGLTAANYQSNGYHHFVVEYVDGNPNGTVNVYIDGSLAYSTSISRLSGSTDTDFRVFRNGAAAANHGSGTVDEIAFYNHPLGLVRVQAHYAKAIGG